MLSPGSWSQSTERVALQFHIVYSIGDEDRPVRAFAKAANFVLKRFQFASLPSNVGIMVFLVSKMTPSVTMLNTAWVH